MNAVLLKRPFIIDILLLEPKTSIVGFKLDDTHSLAHSEAQPAASPDAVSVCEWLKPLAVQMHQRSMQQGCGCRFLLPVSTKQRLAQTQVSRARGSSYISEL